MNSSNRRKSIMISGAKQFIFGIFFIFPFCLDLLLMLILLLLLLLVGWICVEVNCFRIAFIFVFFFCIVSLRRGLRIECWLAGWSCQSHKHRWFSSTNCATAAPNDNWAVHIYIYFVSVSPSTIHPWVLRLDCSSAMNVYEVAAQNYICCLLHCRRAHLGHPHRANSMNKIE